MKVKEFYRGQVVEIDFKRKEGSIQKGKRPAVIVGNDIGNTYAPILLVVPLTTATTKAGMPTHMWIAPSKENGLAANSMLLAEQIMTVTKEAVTKDLGSLTTSQMEKVNEKLKISLGLI